MAIVYPKTEKSKYKYVYIEHKNEKTYYVRTGLCGYSPKRYHTEREAALSADMILIDNGRDPVNILVKKK